MLCSWRIVLLGPLLLFTYALPAHAQFVRVSPWGGVSVRAPFVRVEVDPLGGTYVRAPFTSIYAPPDYDELYEPFYQTPYVQASESEEPSRMQWQQLANVVHTAAIQLESELSQFETAGSWQRYLQPGTLQDLMATGLTGPPDPQLSSRLQTILQAYQTVNRNEEFSRVAQLSSFQRLYAALSELANPEQHQRQLLLADAQQLQQDLLRWASGPSWQEYLALPPSLTHGDSVDQQQIQETVARFERIASSPQYGAIAELRSFANVQQSLYDYLALRGEAALDRPPEELPRPELPVLNAPSNR